MGAERDASMAEYRRTPGRDEGTALCRVDGDMTDPNDPKHTSTLGALLFLLALGAIVIAAGAVLIEAGKIIRDIHTQDAGQ